MALATLAFAALMDSLFFTNPSIIPSGSITVGRPDIFGMRFTTDRAFMVLIAIVFALCLIGVGALRRGPFGRRLVAMSDSQAACATVGMNITETKLAVFILAGGLAGLAGALYGGMSRTVSVSQFSFVNSLVLFVAVALAGITILSGSVQAGIGLAFVPLIGLHIPSISGFTYILFGVGIVAVGRNPYGIGLVYADLGEWWDGRRARPAAGERTCPAARRRSHRAVVTAGGAFRWLTRPRPARRSGAGGQRRLGALRRPAGARCRRPRGGRRRGPRLDRAERRRKDDVVQRRSPACSAPRRGRSTSAPTT